MKTPQRFTPEDVVARYRELGVAPIFGSANVAPMNGSWRFRSDNDRSACAAGVMIVGMPADENDGVSTALEEHFGVRYTPFYMGFDNDRIAGEDEYEWWSAEDYRLGQDCRAAVLAMMGVQDPRQGTP